MLMLIHEPSCDEMSSLVPIAVVHPLTILALALCVPAIMLLQHRDMRLRLTGQSLLFGGMSFGVVPTTNLLFPQSLSPAECSRPEVVERLVGMWPYANVGAWIALLACIVGCLWSLWLVVRCRSAQGKSSD